MNIEERKDLLLQLGQYMLSDNGAWQKAKQKAFSENNWFTTEFVNLAIHNIVHNFLSPDALQTLINQISDRKSSTTNPKLIGIVMAGNIPLVGFHDFLCVFLSGHIAAIKPSSKDDALIRQLVEKLHEWNSDTEQYVRISEMLKNCDAYIATGSNNSSRYFEYYFNKYPHIIRKNRTSVAILTGHETEEELQRLADDVYQYFGLGCRNVTQLYVPEGYDFKPLLDAFNKYHYFIDNNKYKNNYDYNLTILILNSRYYMTNGSVILVEDTSPFSPISQLHYQFYKNKDEVQNGLKSDDSIQCIVSKEEVAFGNAQCPEINDYADGVDTMQFVLSL